MLHGDVAWQDAVEEHADGVLLRIQARPGASGHRFPDGYDPWRGRLGLAVSAPAKDGRANDAALDLVAAFLRVPRAQVVLRAGQQARSKDILVRGAVRDRVVEVLSTCL